MVNRAKRTYPTAEESSQDNGQHNGYQTPQEASVQRVGTEHGTHGNQRIKLKQPVDRPAPQLPPPHAERSYEAKPDKENKEESLGYASYRYDFHFVRTGCGM
jgi:hypothetical protein